MQESANIGGFRGAVGVETNRQSLTVLVIMGVNNLCAIISRMMGNIIIIYPSVAWSEISQTSACREAGQKLTPADGVPFDAPIT
jgi:hypothetical protein